MTWRGFSDWKATDLTLQCDTCGRAIEDGQGLPRREFGVSYIFCCQTCESAFEAASLQRRLIPDPFENEWVSLFIEYVPVLQVGGDYAHVQFSSPTKLYALAGDVSGHGIAASLLMSRISTEVERLVSARLDLAEIVSALDKLIVRATGDRLYFLTLFCLLADLNDGTLSFINCGHPPPLLWSSAASRQYERLTPQIPPLGLFHLADAAAASETRAIDDGSRLVLYTDGLSELEERGEEVGESGIERIVADFVREASPENARKTFERVRRLPKPQDDVLLMLMSFRRPPDR